MKGVIPAAGKGNRLEPLTLAMPKEMIRIGRKPVIEHVIDNLKACGIIDILIITGWKKGPILDYLGSGRRLGVNITYRVQEEQKGPADAVYMSREWVGDDDFVVIYGDNYFRPAENLMRTIQFHRKMKADATLLLHPVDDPSRFGIVKIDSSGKVLGMIEKPTLAEAENYRTGGIFYNIAGLLVLKPMIFDFIKKTRAGRNNEIYLTDSIELMRKGGKGIYGHIFEGVRYDIGTFESLMAADRLEVQHLQK